MEHYGIILDMNEDIEEKHVPEVNFYVTSEEGSNNIITEQLMAGSQPVHVKAKAENVEIGLSLQAYQYKKLEFISNCSENLNPMTCGAIK